MNAVWDSIRKSCSTLYCKIFLCECVNLTSTGIVNKGGAARVCAWLENEHSYDGERALEDVDGSCGQWVFAQLVLTAGI